LYEFYSEVLRDKWNENIVVSDSEHCEIAAFFKNIAKYFKKSVLTYNDELAELYKPAKFVHYPFV